MKELFRKFLSSKDNAYVSITNDSTSFFEDGKSLFMDISLHDGSGTFYQNIWISNSEGKETLDKDYEEEMQKLEILRVAIVTAMDELATGYMALSSAKLEPEEQATDAES